MSEENANNAKPTAATKGGKPVEPWRRKMKKKGLVPPPEKRADAVKQVKDEDGKRTLYKHPFSHKFVEADIPVIMQGLREYKAIIVIADQLNASYSGLRDFIKRTPILRECMDRRDNGMLDIAERRLFERINLGDTHSIMYFLDRKGRKRGYGEHIEQDINENNPNANAPRIVIGAIPPEAVRAAKRQVEEANKQIDSVSEEEAREEFARQDSIRAKEKAADAAHDDKPPTSGGLF